MTAAEIVSVQRGSGTKVHRALFNQGRIIGTWCAAATNSGGRADLTIRKVIAPVDCKKCANSLEPK